MEFALQETAYFFDSVGTAAWKGLRMVGQHLADHVIPHNRNNYHPHLLGHRALALFSLLLICVKVTAIFSLIAFEDPAKTFASAITSDSVISLANQSRQEYGLKALTANSQLAQAAQTKANDMLARQYFAHNTPDGRTPWTFIKDAGYKYLMAGENLAVDFREVEDVEQAWMNSPGHRANILNKNFEEIGIGISEGQFEGHQSIFVVQMFGTPAEQPVAMAEAPTKVEQPVPVSTSPARPEVASARSDIVIAPHPSPVLVTPVQAEKLEILDSSVKLSGDAVMVAAQTSALATKVIVQFGDLAVMLDPKDNNFWQASVPLTKLTNNESTVIVKAYDTAGTEVQKELASFAKSTSANFMPSSAAAATPQAKTANFFGHSFDVKGFESKFYLIFISGILSALILAIGIKRHIQRISLVANSSFVVVLALMLWMTG